MVSADFDATHAARLAHPLPWSLGVAGRFARAVLARGFQMADKHDVVTVTLGSTAGLGGSFTASYPTNRTAEDYLGATAHELHSQSYRALFAEDGDFSLTFGASNITVSILTALSMVSGSVVYLHLDRAEKNVGLGEIAELADDAKMAILTPVKITLGAPATADADGFIASQDLTAAGVFSVNTTFAAAKAAAALNGIADVPRNVVAAWTGTAVLTVTGTDEFGDVVRESSASGTSLTGKKAFKTITGISVSANVTGLTVGTGVVLGLPVFLPDTVDVVREILDGAAATAGTLVAGVTTTATATTGDVRGTYNPNSAPNGARVFELVALLRDPSYTGIAQFAG